MDWAQVMISGAVGAAAGTLFSRIVGKWRHRKVIIIVLTILVIGLWNGIAVKHLFKDTKIKNDRTYIEQKIASIPLMQTIQKYDNLHYNIIVEKFINMRKNDVSQQELIDAIQPQFTSLLLARIRYASDSTVNEHMTASLLQLEELYAQKKQLCFKFLFPEISGGINTVHLLQPATIQRRLQADNALLIDSYEKPRIVNIPQDDVTAQQHLSPIIEQMRLRYGPQLQMLAEPANSNADRENICGMAIDLYQRVLALPADQSAGVLRMMLAE